MRLTKDHTISRLLSKLRGRLGPETFQIVDHWDCDLCAIGIARPDNHAVLVYICTNALPNGRYFASLELPPRPGDEQWANHPFTPAGDYRFLTFEELLALVRKHLSI